MREPTGPMKSVEKPRIPGYGRSQWGAMDRPPSDPSDASGGSLGAEHELIYVDYNATAPVDERVVEAMLPWLSSSTGNASSTHIAGRKAAAAVEAARAAVAATIGAPAGSLVFTSGATEADNIVILGCGGPVAVAATEHKAVLEPAATKEHVVIPVHQSGQVDLDVLAEVVPGARLVSVMLANNETGIVQDLQAIAEIAHRHGCLVHTDATQAVGKLPVAVDELDVDLLSMSAHKLSGPMGVGALYVRRGVRIEPLTHGGGHERGLRPGTMNVPGIVGFGAAVGLIDLERDIPHSRALLDRMERRFLSAGEVGFYSNHSTGLPNTMSVRFVGADAEAVLANALSVAASTGSACTAAIPEPSHVLLAMGVPASAAFEVIRISVGRRTTMADADRVAAILIEAADLVRGLTSDAGVGVR